MKPSSAKFNEDNQKIFLEWKKLYSDAIIDSLNPSKTVLEIGFGAGFAADRIQKHHPKSHIIVESNPEVLIEAKKWVEKHPHAKIVSDPDLKKLGKFDAIFFNDYPIEHDVGIMNFLFPEEHAHRAGEAKKILDSLEEEMAKNTHSFSDQDIDDFYQKSGKHNKKDLPQFFQTLKDNGNISKKQFEHAQKKYHVNDPSDLKKEEKTLDPMLAALEQCLKNNMDKGSRFSSFLNSQVSKYEDAQFFDHIITNPDVNFKETSVSIKMTEKTRNGLILLIEKVV